MGRRPRFTVAEAREALLQTRGAVCLAADRLGVDPSALSHRMKRYPELYEVADSFRQRRTDKAELQLEKAIDRGDLKAVLFQLRTQGKDRGYVERQEFTGKDGDELGATVKLEPGSEVARLCHSALAGRPGAILQDNDSVPEGFAQPE